MIATLDDNYKMSSFTLEMLVGMPYDAVETERFGGDVLIEV